MASGFLTGETLESIGEEFQVLMTGELFSFKTDSGLTVRGSTGTNTAVLTNSCRSTVQLQKTTSRPVVKIRFSGKAGDTLSVYASFDVFPAITQRGTTWRIEIYPTRVGGYTTPHEKLMIEVQGDFQITVLNRTHLFRTRGDKAGNMVGALSFGNVPANRFYDTKTIQFKSTDDELSKGVGLLEMDIEDSLPIFFRICAFNLSTATEIIDVETDTKCTRIGGAPSCDHPILMMFIHGVVAHCMDAIMHRLLVSESGRVNVIKGIEELFAEDGTVNDFLARLTPLHSAQDVADELVNYIASRRTVKVADYDVVTITGASPLFMLVEIVHALEIIDKREPDGQHLAIFIRSHSSRVPPELWNECAQEAANENKGHVSLIHERESSGDDVPLIVLNDLADVRRYLSALQLKCANASREMTNTKMTWAASLRLQEHPESYEDREKRIADEEEAMALESQRLSHKRLQQNVALRQDAETPTPTKAKKEKKKSDKDEATADFKKKISTMVTEADGKGLNRPASPQTPDAKQAAKAAKSAMKRKTKEACDNFLKKHDGKPFDESSGQFITVEKADEIGLSHHEVGVEQTQGVNGKVGGTFTIVRGLRRIGAEFLGQTEPGVLSVCFKQESRTIRPPLGLTSPSCTMKDAGADHIAKIKKISIEYTKGEFEELWEVEAAKSLIHEFIRSKMTLSLTDDEGLVADYTRNWTPVTTTKAIEMTL
jgi:hypothetical protein